MKDGKVIEHHHHFVERQNQVIRDYNLPIQPGIKLPNFPLDLRSQHTPIKGMIIDNANSTTRVLVYQGTSPLGTPYIVLPGWSRGITFSGTSSVYITFPDTPTGTGQIYIAAFDEPIVAFSTQVVTVTTTPPGFVSSRVSLNGSTVFPPVTSSIYAVTPGKTFTLTYLFLTAVPALAGVQQIGCNVDGVQIATLTANSQQIILPNVSIPVVTIIQLVSTTSDSCLWAFQGTISS